MTALSMSNKGLQMLGIATVEGEGDLQVTAQYNPKEVAVDKSVTWSPAKTPTGNTPELQFSAGTNRGLTIELTFDGFEDGTNVHTEYVDQLVQMTAPIDETSSDDDKKRPPKVVVTWGDSGLPTFTGVIESVSTKYTMFLADGTPVRATCSVKFKEADKVSFKKGQ